MKSFVLFLGIIFTLSIKSQTIIRFVQSDGTIDKGNYEYYEHSSGKIIKSFKFRDEIKTDTVHNAIIRIINNKIYCYGKKGHFFENPKELVMDKTETTEELGYLTADKKIISLKDGKASDLATAPYIKDNKIYSSDNKIIAFIEGLEIYGAASYLLSL